MLCVRCLPLPESHITTDSHEMLYVHRLLWNVVQPLMAICRCLLECLRRTASPPQNPILQTLTAAFFFVLFLYFSSISFCFQLLILHLYEQFMMILAISIELEDTVFSSFSIFDGNRTSHFNKYPSSDQNSKNSLAKWRFVLSLVSFRGCQCIMFPQPQFVVFFFFLRGFLMLAHLA